MVSAKVILLKWHIMNDLNEELDNKLFCIGIFIDLSNAFDTVDHKLLIRKLSLWNKRKCITMFYRLSN